MGFLQNNVTAGDYNAVTGAESGAVSNIVISQSYYTRINNIVTCTVFGLFDLDFSTTNTGSFVLTNPFINANFGAGLITINIPKVCNGVYLLGNVTINSDDITLIDTNVFFSVIFTFKIL